MAGNYGMQKRAGISWNAYDVNTVRPGWTLARCDRELVKNEKYIRDRLIELGWDVLEALLPREGERESDSVRPA